MFSPLFITGKNTVDVYNPYAGGIHQASAGDFKSQSPFQFFSRNAEFVYSDTITDY